MHRRKLGTKAIEKVLRYHARTCHHFIFSGDRKCTCGRNQAIAELRVLLKKLGAQA
jgi:hypothetical protein